MKKSFSIRIKGSDRGIRIEKKIRTDVPQVYFSSDIDAETICRLYDAVGIELGGKVAVKVHSGEKGNQNFLGPALWKPLIHRLNGTVVEANTAYAGSRNTTEAHLKTLEEHGWSAEFPVQVLDETGPDTELSVPNGKRIQKNYVGRHLTEYDSLLVLSHFKGHPMGGFGGALKQISIGVASSYGKKYIHGAGEPEKLWTQKQEWFLESMADAASSVAALFKGRTVYINVMKNLSVDCDCVAKAEDPCMGDIGVLASFDPVALDQACLDLLYASNDPGRDKLIERIESRKGVRTLEVAEELGIGVREYHLLSI